MPVSTAYNQWTQFEDFPLFMEGVDHVQQLDDTRLHWAATVAGKTNEWDAKILEQHADKQISWISEDGKKTRGASVRCDGRYVAASRSGSCSDSERRQQVFYDLERVGDVTDNGALRAVPLRVVEHPAGSAYRPNIFIIVVDSLRPDYLSAYQPRCDVHPGDWRVRRRQHRDASRVCAVHGHRAFRAVVVGGWVIQRRYTSSRFRPSTTLNGSRIWVGIADTSASTKFSA